jgi:hypothetical protein
MAGSKGMRDIRGDLQERIKRWEEQVRLANAYCEKMMKQIQTDRDAKVADLKEKIATASKLLEFERVGEEQIEKVVPKATQPATEAAPRKLSLATS